MGGPVVRLVVLSLVAFVFLAAPAFPCSCADTQSVADALKTADVVFTGEVTKLEVLPSWWQDVDGRPDPELLESDPGEDPIRVVKVTFAVGKSWKGVSEPVAVIRTFFECCVCGSAFGVGQAYLVYGYRVPSTGGSLWTNICTRTKELRLASEDLDGLGAPLVDFEARGRKSAKKPKP